MSFKSGLIKMAINMTPSIMIIWVANIILKGIAELTAFSFDLETKKYMFKPGSTVKNKRLKSGWKILPWSAMAILTVLSCNKQNRTGPG